MESGIKNGGVNFRPRQKIKYKSGFKIPLVLKYSSEYPPTFKVVIYFDLLYTSPVKPGSAILAGSAFRNNQSIGEFTPVNPRPPAPVIRP